MAAGTHEQQNNSFKKYKNFYLKDRILSLRVQKKSFL